MIILIVIVIVIYQVAPPLKSLLCFSVVRLDSYEMVLTKARNYYYYVYTNNYMFITITMYYINIMLIYYRIYL